MTVRIKVCGITRAEDAQTAVSLGADFIGLNFYPRSPRCLTLEAAAAIARLVDGRARLVGVFVNAGRDYVDERLRSVGLDLLQFHGDEDDAALRGWSVPVIKALRVRADAPLEALDTSAIRADFVLIDTFHPRLFGGTGRPRPLDALRVLDLGRVFVSGGLTPDSAAEAAALRPYALDVASGVEAAAGIKDPARLRSFIANARADAGTSTIASRSSDRHAKSSR